MTTTLEIKNLCVSVDSKPIIQNLSLTINSGEVHALMGPNGSGKSTLTQVLAGHPKYIVTSGEILFKGTSILGLNPTERAKLGIFLAFQHPLEIPGINVTHFLYSIAKAHNPTITPTTFRKELDTYCKTLDIDKQFLQRELNVGFSGGEKKRLETLQLLILKPECMILDETDSGVDVDSLRLIGEGIASVRSPTRIALVITHYPKILKYIPADHVHIMRNGEIILSGNGELADEIEQKGYHTDQAQQSSESEQITPGGI